MMLGLIKLLIKGCETLLDFLHILQPTTILSFHLGDSVSESSVSCNGLKIFCVPISLDNPSTSNFLSPHNFLSVQ